MADEDGLPAELRRLWGLSAQSRLGRPAELDVERVVRTAVALADRDGLAGVTLPKVARELGYTSMSLYRHVGSKDELLTLMANAALGPPPELDEDGHWRDGLRRWSHAEREVHLNRPWLSRIPISGPPSGPNQIAWMDRALAALRGTGLDWAAKIGILTVVSGHVRHMSLLAQELAGGRAEGQDQLGAERSYGRALATLVHPARFPEAAALFASTVFDGPVPAPEPGRTGNLDGDFAFGLELILDGVAEAIRRAAAPTPD